VGQHFWTRLRFWWQHLMYDEKYASIGYWLGVAAAFVWHGSAGLLIGWLIAVLVTFFTG
jgi:hypothetical protein